MIAEDDSTIKLGATPGTSDESRRQRPPRRPPSAPETTLVLGYNAGLHADARASSTSTSTPRLARDDRRRRQRPGLPRLHEHRQSPSAAATPPAARCSTRSTSQPSTTSSCSPPTRRSHAQRADAKTLITLLHLRDIADAARRRPQRGQRDARRPQPRTGRGHQGRRLHRQRQADQPDAVAGEREQAADRGLRPAVLSDGSRDLPAPGRAVHQAGRRASTSTRCSRRPAAAARPRSATASTTHARSAEHDYGVSVNPHEDRRRTLRAGRQDHRARGALSARRCSAAKRGSTRACREATAARVVRRLRLRPGRRRTSASR